MYVTFPKSDHWTAKTKTKRKTRTKTDTKTKTRTIQELFILCVSLFPSRAIGQQRPSLR